MDYLILLAWIAAVFSGALVGYGIKSLLEQKRRG